MSADGSRRGGVLVANAQLLVLARKQRRQGR